jgi:hypothetical protein
MGDRTTTTRKPKPGDIFEIPLPDGAIGYGQVVLANRVLYVIVFRKIYASRPDLSEIPTSGPALASWTTDALIHHGAWKIIGNAPVDVSTVPFPSHRVLIKGVHHVGDFDAKHFRPATEAEAALLDQRTSVSPMVLQNALAALHGRLPRDDSVDKLTVEYLAKRVI